MSINVRVFITGFRSSASKYFVLFVSINVRVFIAGFRSSASLKYVSDVLQ